MGGSPPTIVNAPPATTTLLQARNPRESYQDLANLNRSYYDQSAAARRRLESQVGTEEDIGQRSLDRDVYTAALQQSSLPTAASPELKEFTQSLLARAKQKAAAGPRPGAPEPAYQEPSWVRGQTQEEIDQETRRTA